MHRHVTALLDCARMLPLPNRASAAPNAERMHGPSLQSLVFKQVSSFILLQVNFFSIHIRQITYGASSPHGMRDTTLWADHTCSLSRCMSQGCTCVACKSALFMIKK